MQLLVTSLYIVFVLSAVVLAVIVLLQEGKGGGLTNALGAAGQETFGVGASGVHKVTAWLGALFLVSALAIHYVNRVDATSSMFGPAQSSGAPVESGR